MTKTTGIILHCTRYTDNSSIATIYTQHFGRLAFIVHHSKSRKTACKMAFLQPLCVVEIDLTYRPNKNIQHLNDIHVAIPFGDIPHNAAKNAIALFIAEILYKSLRLSEPDKTLFVFLENALKTLDETQTAANFHLVFLLKLANYLGFEPNKENAEKSFFDLINGVFVDCQPPHNCFLAENECQNFAKLLVLDFNTMPTLRLSQRDRNALLQNILAFYKIHIPDFSDLHSLAVLQMLFEA